MPPSPPAPTRVPCASCRNNVRLVHASWFDTTRLTGAWARFLPTGCFGKGEVGRDGRSGRRAGSRAFQNMRSSTPAIPCRIGHRGRATSLCRHRWRPQKPAGRPDSTFTRCCNDKYKLENWVPSCLEYPFSKHSVETHSIGYAGGLEESLPAPHLLFVSHFISGPIQ